MAKLFSAREIAVAALRIIGVVAPNDSSTPENRILDTLKWLDLMLGHTSGSERLWFFTPQDLTFTYPADADSCDMTALLGSNNGLDMTRYAYNDDTDDEISLLSRTDWDQSKNGGLFPFLTGRALYIVSDGDDTYTAYLRPVPTLDFNIRVTGQKLAPSVSAAVNSSSELAHGFERPWQLWMVIKLAAIIGNGPQAKLPESRVKMYDDKATELWNELKAYRSGGQRKAGRFTQAWRG